MNICKYLTCACLVLSACAADTDFTAEESQAGPDALVAARPAEDNLEYVLDGTPINQESLKKRAAEPLIFIYDDRTEREGVVHVFSKEDDAIAYRRAWQPSASSDSKQPSDAALEPGVEVTSDSSSNLIGSAPGHISLYLHANRQGDEWTFYPENGAILDFTCAWRVFWVCQNINDRASSADNRSRHWVRLHQHTYLNGNQYWIAPHSIINDFGSYFNDITSSMDFDYE